MYLKLITILSVSTTLSAEVITLDRAESLARQQNQQVRMSLMQVEQQATQTSIARTRRNPQISTQLQAGLLVNRANVTFARGSLGEYPGTGPIPDKDMEVGIPRTIAGYSMVTVSQPLTAQYRLGKAVAIAEVDREIAKSEARRTENEVIAQVRQAYFQILTMKPARERAARGLDLARETARLAREGVDQGTALPADLAEAEARVAQAVADVANLQSTEQGYREALNRLMGQPLAAEYELETPAAVPMPDSEVQAGDRAKSNRPEVAQARLRIQQTELSLKSKRSEYIPDISLTFSHIGFINTGNLAPRNFTTAGLQMSWEPFDWGRRRHEQSAIRFQNQVVRLQKEDVERRVELQAHESVRAYHVALRNLEAANAAVKATEEALRVATERFRKQAALMRQVLEVQTTYATALENVARAEAASATAWANVQLAQGN